METEGRKEGKKDGWERKEGMNGREEGIQQKEGRKEGRKEK